MDFYPNQLFHIYNQGNNKQLIFLNDDNYEFFLWKMRAHLLPFGDLIAYCLMPNHFHWLFYVRKIELDRIKLRTHVHQIENKRRQKKYGKDAKPLKVSINSNPNETSVKINDEIGNLQKSYTRAFNKQNNRTGSLFRRRCKRKDGWIDDFITLKNSNNKTNFRFMTGNSYAYNCLNYIHKNPLEAGLVKKNTAWNYSSAKDYAGLRNGSLCNVELGNEIINFIS